MFLCVSTLPRSMYRKVTPKRTLGPFNFEVDMVS